MTNIIKDRRNELGLTLKEIADAVGVSEATVSRWETGEIEDMKRNRIVQLSKVLKISPLVLLGLPDTEKQPTRMDELSEEEKALIEAFRTVPKEERNGKMAAVTSLVRQQ